MPGASAELFLFLLMPAVVGGAIILASVWSIARSPSIIQLALGVPIIAVTAWSLWVLLRIWNGAWPTYVPHIALAAVCPIMAVQFYLSKKR